MTVSQKNIKKQKKTKENLNKKVKNEGRDKK